MPKLKYDINAFVLIEEVLGASLAEIASNPARLEKVSTLRALFWAGNLHSNPKLTMAEAGRNMQARLEDGVTLAQISEEIFKAIEASGVFPKVSEPDNADPQISPAN